MFLSLYAKKESSHDNTNSRSIYSQSLKLKEVFYDLVENSYKANIWEENCVKNDPELVKLHRDLRVKLTEFQNKYGIMSFAKRKGLKELKKKLWLQ